MRLFQNAAVFSLFMSVTSSVCAADSSESQTGLTRSPFPGVTYASIATESEKPTSEAPAVISVITAEDLHNHGITSLEQALEEVPGVYSPFRFLNGHFVIRGVRSQIFNNTETLILVDGVPQNDVVSGTHQRIITRIPIGNIERIEIIRGPGSAVYGADAFAGVINIITKTDQEYDSTEIRGRAGSYDTVEIDGIFKGKLGKTATLLSLQARDTDGHEPLIKADAQSYFDGLFGTNVSLAPDEASTFFREYNISFEVFQDDFRARTQYRDHKLGMGTSLMSALTEGGRGSAEQFNIDLFYSINDSVDDWVIKTRLNYLDVESYGKKNFLPPGAFGETFPEGVLSFMLFHERHLMIDVKGFYLGNPDHEIVLGLGILHAKTYDTEESANFTVLPGGIFAPIDQYVSLPPDEMIWPLASRQVKYLTLNDDWTFAKNFLLSAGARVDHYSDLGSTINPRIALIWLTQHDLTTKFILNRAFRAPNFVELYNRLPAQLGNPDLEPAIINTAEIAIEKLYFEGSKLSISIFEHRITDFIELVPDQAGNLFTTNSTDDVGGRGIEIESQIPFADKLDLKGSYSYQKNEREGSTFYNAAPHHKIYAGIDWHFRRNWNLYTNILWVNDFTRDVNDPREDLGSSSFVGTVLRYTSPTRRWDTYLSIRNIFDEEAVAPSDDYRFLPNDYPLSGTNYMVEMRYRM